MVLGVGQYEPAAQGAHVEFELAPVAIEYEPLAHNVGAMEDSGQYLPAVHKTPMSIEVRDVQ